MIDNEANIKRFEELISNINREGVDDLMNYIRNKTDFYTAPASTQFHLSCEGGLLQHSLNVYDCLMAKIDNALWKPILEDIDSESLIIVALFHDLCKVNMYVKGTKNQKTYDPEKVSKASEREIKSDALGKFIWETVLRYEVKDSMPLGHGEKSVMLINCFMKLKTQEIFAIRWHMGFSEEKSLYKSLGDAMEKYPLVLALHEADLEASKIIEGEDGNKVQKSVEMDL